MELLLNVRNFTQNCNWHKKLLDIPARDSAAFNFTPTKMKLGNGRGDSHNSILVIQISRFSGEKTPAMLIC